MMANAMTNIVHTANLHNHANVQYIDLARLNFAQKCKNKVLLQL